MQTAIPILCDFCSGLAQGLGIAAGMCIGLAIANFVSDVFGT